MHKTTKKILFGINDCKKPKKNFTLKEFSKKSRQWKKRSYNYKNIILFPHNLGQTKLGVEKAPAYLNKFINHKKHVVNNVRDTGDMFKNLTNLYRMNARLGGKIVNIGGDHSMSIATIADTLNKYPSAKVIYFDAHADLNTFKSSKGKNYHGMPLSFITGIDKDNHFSFIKNILPFENLFYIGSRCWDKFEIDIIYKEGIKFLTPNDINNDFENSLNIIKNFIGNSPVHISFDVDSIDPKYIPSTGTYVKNGIELNNAIEFLDNLNNLNIVKLDITELNIDIGKKHNGEKSAINTKKLFHNFIN